jgi:hypothetical protein
MTRHRRSSQHRGGARAGRRRGRKRETAGDAITQVAGRLSELRNSSIAKAPVADIAIGFS